MASAACEQTSRGVMLDLMIRSLMRGLKEEEYGSLCSLHWLGFTSFERRITA